MQEGYGILPNRLLFDQKISSSAKLFFVCLSSLSAEKGYCFASNAYLAKKMGVTSRQVQRWLEELETIVYVEFSSPTQREIYPHPDLQMVRGVTKKTGGGDKNVTHNNTSIKDSTKVESKSESSTESDRNALATLFTLLGRPSSKVTPGRIAKLKQRLRSYQLSELEAAATAIAASDFMVKGGHNNIDYLLRNDEKVEYWINKEEPAEMEFA